MTERTMKTSASDPRQGPAGRPDASVPIHDESVIRRIVRLFGREPMLLITCAYVFISIVGIWDSYWFYRRFDVPILEYMQSSDYFVAGLRRPIYALALAALLLIAALGLWPDRWSMRNPERAEHLRRTKWWGKAVLARRYDPVAYGGMHPETATTITVAVSIVILLFIATNLRANRIERGGGHAVSVTLIGAPSPMVGSLHLLGTSSAFVFLWRTDESRPEVVPIQSIHRIRTLDRTTMKPVGSEVPKPEATEAATSRDLNHSGFPEGPSLERSEP